MKKLNQKGITLIALVITIIVLLILAGVSIAMLIGQNGILTQAQSAKTTNENKSAEEKVKLAIMAARSQSETGALDADKLVTEVTTNYGGKATKTGDGFPVIVTIDGKSFTVDGDGNVNSKDSETAGQVTIIEGDGKNVGNIIAITSKSGTKEEFYVLSYDESTQKAKALAKYNLKVELIYNDNNNSTVIATDSAGYGLQNSEMKGWVSSGLPWNGVLPFSRSKYWDDTYTPQGNSSYPWVYNNKSYLYQYVEGYKTLLGNTDKVSEVSLASYEDINTLWSNKSKYPWLYSTSYWTGSAYGASNYTVWYVGTDGSFSYNDIGANYSVYYGVRPVITIDMSKI